MSERNPVILLLRGINVGAANRLRMADLRRILEGLGVEEVETYIQSGNAVGRSARKDMLPLDEQIAGAIEARHGFRPRVLVLGAHRLLDAIEANPFPEADDAPASLHLFFLAEPPSNPSADRSSPRTSRNTSASPRPPGTGARYGS